MATYSNRPKRGDKIDLYHNKGAKFRTVVDDVTDDGLLVMPVPSRKGISMIAKRGDKLSMTFYRNNGKYNCDVLVRDIVIEGLVRLFIIEMKSEAAKEQNRDAFRLPVSVNVKIYQYPNGEIPDDLNPNTPGSTVTLGTTKDVSASGALINTKCVLDLDESVLVALYIYGDSQAPLVLASKVVRIVNEHNEGIYEMGFQFVDDTTKQDALQKYVINRQQKTAKWQKALSDNDG